MKSLGYKQAVRVASLPTPTAALEGVTVHLTSDDKPYYCDGAAWTLAIVTDAERTAWNAKATITVSSTAPASPALNDLWLEI